MHIAVTSAETPSAMSRPAIAERCRIPMSTTMFVPARLSADQSTRLAGSSGWRCPETTLNPAAPSVLVSGRPPSTGPAMALVTPGTTSTARPAFVQDATSCAPCAKTNESPPFKRTTFLPARARSTMRLTISSYVNVRLPGEREASITSTSGPSLVSSPVGANRSWITTSAASNRSRPRTVMRSSAPGPPPINTTRPVSAMLDDLP